MLRLTIIPASLPVVITEEIPAVFLVLLVPALWTPALFSVYVIDAVWFPALFQAPTYVCT